MKALLASLGYTQAFTISKTRKTWILNRSDDKPQITLCIDSVTGLGNYAELETLVNSPEDVQRATDMLLDMLNAFNIPRENLTRKSYLELLFMANKC